MALKGDKFIAKSIVPGVPDVLIVFKGMQETGFEEFPAFALYDLTADIPGHPKDSTVGRDTLEESGYVLPKEAP
jgi:hypothetical protein